MSWGRSRCMCSPCCWCCCLLVLLASEAQRAYGHSSSRRSTDGSSNSAAPRPNIVPATRNEQDSKRQRLPKFVDCLPQHRFLLFKTDDTDSNPGDAVDAHRVTIGPSCNAEPLGACNQALLQALSACSPRDCSIVLQPGSYRWSMEMPVRASGLDVKLEAHGAVLQLTGPAVRAPALLQFDNCTSVTVAGLTIDAPRPLYTLGLVESTQNATSSFRMRVDPLQYPLVSASASGRPRLLWPWLGYAQSVLGWDPKRNRPGGPAKAVDIYQLDAQSDSFRAVEESVAEVHVSSSYMTNGAGFGEIKVGQTLLVRHAVYTSTGLLVNNCSNVSIQDVTLFACPGMGFKAQRSRDLMLTRYRVTRAKGRPMSTCADAAHFETCGGRIDISNSLFEGQGDDGVNVHSNFLEVTANPAHGSATALVCLRQEGLCREGYDGGAFDFLETGDNVLFYSRYTLQPVLTTTVVEMKPVGNATSITFTDTLPLAVERYSQLVSLRSRPTVSVTDSRFANNRARGILCGTKGVLIRNNTFFGTSGSAFKEQPGNFEYAESSYLEDFLFEGNEIVDVNAGPVQHPASVWISTFQSEWDQTGAPTRKGAPLSSGTAMRNVSVVRNHFVQNLTQVHLPAVGIDSTAVVNISCNDVDYTGCSQLGCKQNPLVLDITSSTAVTTVRNDCSRDGVSALCKVSVTQPVAAVDNARARIDERGYIVDAHDAGPFQLSNDTKAGVFWLGLAYGEYPLQQPTGCSHGPSSGSAGFRLDHNVTLHWAPSITSSVWEFKTSLLPISERPAGIYWRPRLLQTAHGFVLWVRRAIVLPGFTTGWHTENTYLVATAQNVLGPYTIVNHNATVRYPDRGSGGGGDMALFLDDDRSCYLAYTGGEGIVVEKLDRTCTRSTAEASIPMHADCEAPALFKHNNTYHLFFGQKCCFCREGSGVHVYTSSSSPLGPWYYQGQINRLGNGSIGNQPRINAQQAGITDIDGEAVWVGDRWAHSPNGEKGSDPQAWLPLEWDPQGRVKQLEWESSWTPRPH